MINICNDLNTLLFTVEEREKKIVCGCEVWIIATGVPVPDELPRLPHTVSRRIHESSSDAEHLLSILPGSLRQ